MNEIAQKLLDDARTLVNEFEPTSVNPSVERKIFVKLIEAIEEVLEDGSSKSN